MKISVTKELGTKAVPELGKEHAHTTYAVEATGLQTKEDLQEIIRQVQLVESQMAGGLERRTSFSEKCYLKGEFNLNRECVN